MKRIQNVMLAVGIVLVGLAITSNAADPTGTYVDATTANTTNRTGGAWVTGPSGSDADNLWNERDGYGLGSTIMETSAAENAPKLITTITGLTPGERYKVRVVFNGNTDWYIDASLNAVALNTYQIGSNDVTDLEAGYNGDRCEAVLGVALADASGELNVYIGADSKVGNRVWYDGVSYEETTEPVTSGYVDATTANTTNLTGGAWVTGPSGSNYDNLWRERDDYGVGGTIMETSAAENAPKLITTITGLTPGERYKVRVVFNGNTDWYIDACLNAVALNTYQIGSNDVTDLEAGYNGDRCAAVLGVALADASGELNVYIGADSKVGSRVWYDGVSYEETTEPVTSGYVDATTANTTNLTGGAWVTGPSGSNTDNLWRERDDYGLGGTIMETSAAENAPKLITTITGLTPGERYKVRVVFNGNTDWYIDACLNAVALNTYQIGSNDVTDLEAGYNGDRCAAVLGVALADASGELNVYIGADSKVGSRVWYDGVSYEYLGPPQGTVIMFR